MIQEMLTLSRELFEKCSIPPNTNIQFWNLETLGNMRLRSNDYSFAAWVEAPEKKDSAWIVFHMLSSERIRGRFWCGYSKKRKLFILVGDSNG